MRGASSSVLLESNAAPVALRQLNKVEADVQTHIQEVWGKICSIMEDFFNKHVSKYEVIFQNKSDFKLESFISDHDIITRCGRPFLRKQCV